MDAPAPAQAEMAMVIGNRRVPLASARLAGADGNFKEHRLADLSVRRLGADGKLGRTSIWHLLDGKDPWKVPLVDEIKQAIASLRVKRNSKGTRFGADGKVLPGIVPIVIRGREILAEDNVQGLRVALGDSLETMNWFLKQVWNDMQNAPGVRRAPAEDAFKELYMAETLGKLRAHKRIRHASYDAHHKRIRVGVHGSRSPLYKHVKQAHTFLAAEDLDGMEDFLAQTVDSIIGELECLDGVPDQELHAPGDQALQAPGQDGAANSEHHAPGEDGAAGQQLHAPGGPHLPPQGDAPGHAERRSALDADAPGPHLPPQGDAPGHAEGATAHDADAPGPHLPPHGDAPGHDEGIAPFAQAANCDLGFDGAAADPGETSASAQDLANHPGVLGGG